MAHEHKYSGGKVRYDLVDPEAIHGIALAFTHGQDKGYEEYSWQKVPVQEYIGAYQRHMREHLKYIKTGFMKHAVDHSSGLLHIDHATACLNIIRWYATQDNNVVRHLNKEEAKREALIEANHV